MQKTNKFSTFQSENCGTGGRRNMTTNSSNMSAEGGGSVSTLELLSPDLLVHISGFLPLEPFKELRLASKKLRDIPVDRALKVGPLSSKMCSAMVQGVMGDDPWSTQFRRLLSGKFAVMAQIAVITQGVMGNDPEVQTDCVTQFIRLLGKKNPPIQQVIDAGVVPRFVEFLERNSNDDDVREQLIGALGNIAGDSPRYRDLVLGAGAMQPLLMQLDANSKLSMQRIATRTLSNFCRGKPQPDFEMVRPALSTLAELIGGPDEEVITDACWALSFLCDGPNERIQAVIEAGVCHRLVELLPNPSPAVQTPALRTVGHIVTGNEPQTQHVVDNNALPYLLALLSSPQKDIRKEACWTISNITAGNEEQIQAVIDNDIIPPLIETLTNAEFDIRKEAVWAIRNATDGNGEQIKFLVQQGCIRPLCDVLVVSDPKIVTIALEGLENILKVGDEEARQTNTQNQMALYISEAEGLNKIEDLQQHTNSNIHEKCVKIMETYFGVKRGTVYFNEIEKEL